uniref:Uncharacterized protein n=1 Tax=Anopheles melas TaxID=34690 RepID=A0A182TXV0_9DIPT
MISDDTQTVEESITWVASDLDDLSRNRCSQNRLPKVADAPGNACVGLVTADTLPVLMNEADELLADKGKVDSGSVPVGVVGEKSCFLLRSRIGNLFREQLRSSSSVLNRGRVLAIAPALQLCAPIERGRWATVGGSVVDEEETVGSHKRMLTSSLAGCRVGSGLGTAIVVRAFGSFGVDDISSRFSTLASCTLASGGERRRKATPPASGGPLFGTADGGRFCVWIWSGSRSRNSSCRKRREPSRYVLQPSSRHTSEYRQTFWKAVG